MEDIEQPSSEPYEVGEQVQVYLGVDDPDASYHGDVVVIVDRDVDQLDEETGRVLDRYSYDVKRVETGQVIPVSFRHRDLVLVQGNQ